MGSRKNSPRKRKYQCCHIIKRVARPAHQPHLPSFCIVLNCNSIVTYHPSQHLFRPYDGQRTRNLISIKSPLRLSFLRWELDIFITKYRYARTRQSHLVFFFALRSDFSTRGRIAHPRYGLLNLVLLSVLKLITTALFFDTWSQDVDVGRMEVIFQCCRVISQMVA